MGGAASFGSTDGLTIDGTGNLYVSDAANGTMRKVVSATGAVSTAAGTAGQSSRADGIGSAARFHEPADVAADGQGNLYIADLLNATIRKIVMATGAVSTLAGSAGQTGKVDGIGSAARFSQPAGLALDGTGNLYVADSLGCTIRKIVLGTGAVSTLAGGTCGSVDGIGPAASFGAPSALALDGAGNLYVADSGNKTIRKIALSTTAVSTLAGSAGVRGSTDGIGTAARFSIPRGLAADGAGNLYVVDSLNGRIRKIVLATAAVSTLSGTVGRLYAPERATLDGAGNLYVSDSDQATVRKVALATGDVTTAVGVTRQTGIQLGALPARLTYPTGLAWSSGELVIVDRVEGVVLGAR